MNNLPCDNNNIANSYNEQYYKNRINQIKVQNNKLLSTNYKKRAVAIDITLNKLSDKCSICLDTFSSNQKVSLLRCKHVFHEECIKSWLSSHSNCPVDRMKADDYQIVSSTEKLILELETQCENNLKENYTNLQLSRIFIALIAIIIELGVIILYLL